MGPASAASSLGLHRREQSFGPRRPLGRQLDTDWPGILRKRPCTRFDVRSADSVGDSAYSSPPNLRCGVNDYTGDRN